MNNIMIKINLTNHKITKRLKTAPDSYDTLLVLLRGFMEKAAIISGQKSKEIKMDSLVVTYIDPEGDESLVENDDDYHTALELVVDQILRISVKSIEDISETPKTEQEIIINKLNAELCTMKEAVEKSIEKHSMGRKKNKKCKKTEKKSDKKSEKKGIKKCIKKMKKIACDPAEEEVLNGLKDILPNFGQLTLEDDSAEGFSPHRKEEFKKNRKCLKQQLNQCVSFMIKETIEEALPQIYSQINTNITDDNIYHDMTCNGCGTCPIVGVSYKCPVCENFNFCSICESEKEHIHPFVKIKNVKQAPLDVKAVVLNEGQSLEDFYLDNGNSLAAEAVNKRENLLIEKCLTLPPCLFNETKQKVQNILGNHWGRPKYSVTKFEEKMAVITINYDEHITTTPNLTIFKKWKIENMTSKPWPSDVYLKQIGGDFTIEESNVAAKLQAQESFDLTIAVVAPPKEGKYMAVMGLFSDDRRFGEELIVSLDVVGESDGEKEQLAQLQLAIDLTNKGMGTFEEVLAVLRASNVETAETRKKWGV